MADNGDDAGETGGDTGEFVFGDERTTDSESGALLDAETVLTAALLVVAVVVLVYVAQLLVTGAVTDLLGADSGGENTVPNGTATGTTATVGTASETDSTRREGDMAGSATTAAQRTSVPPAPPTAQTPTATPTRTATTMATATPTRTATTTPETTATPADEGGDGAGGDNGTTGTAPTGERSPAIDAFTVTDRSGGGAATFEVAWNVSDPDRDLVAVRITLVAGPDGEARTVARRRFDAGGARATGTTTFEVPEGGGAVYEVRIEAVDGSGNTAFSLTRAVADGSPDG